MYTQHNLTLVKDILHTKIRLRLERSNLRWLQKIRNKTNEL